MSPAPARTSWVDFHNHVIPGVDDGAPDPETAAAAVRALAADGVAVIVASPHVDASSTLDPARREARLARLDEGWRRLESVAPEGGPALHRGAEIRLDEPHPDLADPRLRIAGGSAVLVEFAYFTVPPNSTAPLAWIREHGWIPVLAHPERYGALGTSPSLAAEWIAAGAYLQVNAGSLVGRYGGGPRETALRLLEAGRVHCLSSDYHARGRPLLAEARGMLESEGGADLARLLFEENPSRLLRGEPCQAMEPLRRGSRLRRWLEDLVSVGRRRGAHPG